MRQRLIKIDLVLVAVLVLLGSELRLKYVRAKARENAFLFAVLSPAETQSLARSGKFAPLDATAFEDIVTKNLFSSDRNSTPIPDPPPPPPPPPEQPPFPVAHGVMFWAGAPLTIILSSKKDRGDQRSYHSGETVGEWKLSSLDNRYVVLEWNGQRFKKRIDELMDRAPIPAIEPPQQPDAVLQSPAIQPAPKLVAVLAAKSLAQSGIKPCAKDDKSAPGSLLDGRKKIVSQTPSGSICRWEPVTQ